MEGGGDYGAGGCGDDVVGGVGRHGEIWLVVSVVVKFLFWWVLLIDASFGCVIEPRCQC